MSELKDPNKAIDYIILSSGQFAEAKAIRVYLEEFRKSKKAILMSQSEEKTAVGREQYAYSHQEYIDLLAGLKVAIEEEETLKWKLIAAQARIDVWRTNEASNRTQDKVMR